MPTVRSRLLGFAALICLFGLLGFVEWNAYQHHGETKTYGAHHAANNSGAQQSSDLPWWYPTDAIGLYTLLLAAFTGGLFVATTGLWIFTGLLWKSTIRAVEGEERAIKAALDHVTQSSRAADAMKDVALAMQAANKLGEENLAASQRAWLRAEITIISPLKFTREGEEIGCSIGFCVEIENVEKSPATKVNIRHDLILHRHDRAADRNRLWAEISQQQTGIALAAKGWRQPADEQIIFPGKTFEERMNLMAMHSPEEGIVYDSRAVKIFLVGCVDYDFPFGAGHHQTWFSGEVRRRYQPNLLINQIDFEPDDLMIVDAIELQKYAD